MRHPDSTPSTQPLHHDFGARKLPEAAALAGPPDPNPLPQRQPCRHPKVDYNGKDRGATCPGATVGSIVGPMDGREPGRRFDRLNSMRRNTLPLLVAALVLGCGTEQASEPGEGTNASNTTEQRETEYTATATVLESAEHGPQLCLGGVNDSYPPQCSGPDLVGWNWDAVKGDETAGGSTWGSYTVVGTWDGDSLTLTEPPRDPVEDDASRIDDPSDQFTTPCETPEGGWSVVDPILTSDDAMRQAISYSRSQSDVGGVWVDQSINPTAGQEPVDEMAMNDPNKTILNLSFTGDLERHRAAVRDIWGGPLCVSQAATSAAELATIRAEVEADLGTFLYSSTDEVNGQIDIGVTIDDGIQQRLDERYGEGVIELHPALRPAKG